MFGCLGSIGPIGKKDIVQCRRDIWNTALSIYDDIDPKTFGNMLTHTEYSNAFRPTQSVS